MKRGGELAKNERKGVWVVVFSWPVTDIPVFLTNKVSIKNAEFSIFLRHFERKITQKAWKPCLENKLLAERLQIVSTTRSVAEIQYGTQNSEWCKLFARMVFSFKKKSQSLSWVYHVLMASFSTYMPIPCWRRDRS